MSECAAAPSDTTDSGASLLLQAARCGSTATVEKLLKEKCDVTSTDVNGHTAFEIASSLRQKKGSLHAGGQYTDCARLLARAAIERLARAEITGDWREAQRLRKAGVAVYANRNVGSQVQAPALMMAVKTQNFRLAQVLLHAGADLNCRDSQHQTVMHVAASHGFPAFIHMACKLFLFYSDEDYDTLSRIVNTLDARGALPVHLAALYSHPEALKALVTYGSTTGTPYCQTTLLALAKEDVTESIRGCHAGDESERLDTVAICQQLLAKMLERLEQSVDEDDTVHEPTADTTTVIEVPSPEQRQRQRSRVVGHNSKHGSKCTCTCDPSSARSVHDARCPVVLRRFTREIPLWKRLAQYSLRTKDTKGSVMIDAKTP